MRKLNPLEVENIAFLTRYDLDFGLLEPTENGLRKGILDATNEYRKFLLRNAIHNYSSQEQGQDHKLYVPAHFLLPTGEVVSARASLYRPDTKMGDARVWFSRMRNYCQPHDILVSLWSKEGLWILNATRVRFATSASLSEHYRKLLHAFTEGRESIFEELLEKLRELSARGPIPVYKQADAGGGHLLETELGIRQNSSENPDYKGIELKSTRAPRLARSNLFVKVPDWELSQVIDAQDMLREFGYRRGRERKLNCTISAAAWNAQGLKFEVDEESDLLHVVSQRIDIPKPETWRLQGLRDKLTAKHADTFWVTGESHFVGPVEYIHFQSATQTSKPIVQQLSPMLRSGAITMDHMLTSSGDKGPEFKVHKKHINELFPAPIFHDLTVH
ncbi:MvaI/BcnI family restriction endonuclease [Arthrobacter sp. SLBN-100]|uniref:MvaI/BcnI family restriction endonuclease n=1 Tax=Arthrobacter sp. SLBN-100 TaxID=2768450 RepID=UPI00135CA838|nr:MvaI/BcnI family restriction endonuclease [Arthrobacter sp. SLBN-100]